MASWERAMLQWPNGDRCDRSPETIETALRLLRWRGAAEGCSNCGKRAIAVCSRQAFCATCQGQRAARVLERRRGSIAGASGDVGAVATGTESGGTLRGHAIVFGARSVDLGGFREIIRPEAVDRTIAEKTDLRALWNHDSSLPIGRVSAGTLVTRKDARGLRVTIAAPSSARAYVESVERRDVTACRSRSAPSMIRGIWRTVCQFGRSPTWR